MVFNSFQFIFFLPGVVLGVTLLRKHIALRNAFLLLSSLSFYGCFKFAFLPLLLYVIAVNYLGGLALASVETCAAGHSRSQKWTLGGIVLLTLFPLLFFKYTLFLTTTLERLFDATDILLPGWLNGLVLPVGISFFSLQALTYTIDVYRGKISAERNVINVALAISFFPTLLSGPITRARELLPQLKTQLNPSLETYVFGGETFIWGLFKKAVVADRLAEYVDVLFAAPQNYSGLSLLFGAIGYSIQIYCDFSGYSDMAVGAANTIGFKLPENFHQPYFATGIRDFWKRWHISLTSWFTEYLYISCGGNRVSKPRWTLNILLVFLVSGLWHGASWNFLVWGALHGMLYLCEYAVCGKVKSQIGPWYQQFGKALLTFSTVTLAWIFFRMPTIDKSWTVIQRIALHLGDGKFYTTASSFSFALMWFVVLVAFAGEIRIWCQSKSAAAISPLSAGNLVWCLSLLVAVELLSISSSQFVYFLF